jgi:hypothetical protein
MNAPEGLDLVRLKIYGGIFALRFLFYTPYHFLLEYLQVITYIELHS